MGYFVPDVMGVGYNHASIRYLNGGVVLEDSRALRGAQNRRHCGLPRFGQRGGIFGPSLFMGAMMGAAVGGVAHSWFPLYTAGPGAYALVGMGVPAFAGRPVPFAH